ncbi:hypothetical protein [Bacillus sp. EB01]|uniref:hypothetical protein n=1 Tax=Bacillus sp. EB01 TaxID=1347086 RepID=UPI0005C5D973|nr:hypothetical protein [Bacillus sp. EB01]
MKINFSFLRIAGSLTIFLFSYAGITYLDQISHSAVVTDYSKLTKPGSVSKSDFQHLKQLGFSDMSITHLKEGEIENLKGVNGKVVAENDIYRELNGDGELRLTKEEYEKRVKSYSGSVLPKFKTLQQIHMKLIDEGNNRYLAITEHHFDFNPMSGKPLGIELQLNSHYTLLEHMARQISWTVPSFNHDKIKSSTAAVEAGDPPNVNEDYPFFDNSPASSLFYTVPWKQAGLLRETVGLYFFTVTRFEVPGDWLGVDMYVQGQNPHLSDVVQYDLQSAQ